MKKLLTVIVLMLLIAVGVIAGSPYYMAYQMGQAYEARDGDALARHIDFEQVRPSIKNQLTTRFQATLAQYPAIDQLGGDPLRAFASQFINTSVDKAVTADNVANLIRTQGQVDDATKQLAVAWAIASNKVNLTELVQGMIANRGDVQAVAKEQMAQVLASPEFEQARQGNTSTTDSQPTLAYCGYDCFTIEGEVQGFPVTAYLQRQGLVNWQVVDVELP